VPKQKQERNLEENFYFSSPKNAKFGAMKSVCINISLMALLHYSQKTRRQRQRKDEEEKSLRREYEERKT